MALEEKTCHCNAGNQADGTNINLNQDPKNLQSANVLINALRLKCRDQAEQILTLKKLYNIQEEINFRQQKKKNDQLNAVTSQLLLLQSRLMRKQKQICNILGQRDKMILRQQKIIEALSSRLIDHGLDTADVNGCNDFDSLNDSDSAVVLEDIDSDCNSSLISRTRKPCSGDVTIIRSISDAIETNLKYSNVRRSNCFLRRPDILETVYSVEEDPEQGQSTNNINEKRDKFKNRTERIEDHTNDEDSCIEDHLGWRSSTLTLTYNNQTNYLTDTMNSSKSLASPLNCDKNSKHAQVTNYNRVMSNHRNVTKPKDVKYKRINKAKSKSLEELRGKLRNWVEKGNQNDSGIASNSENSCLA